MVGAWLKETTLATLWWAAAADKAVEHAALVLRCGEAVSPRSCPQLGSSLVIERRQLRDWGSRL